MSTRNSVGQAIVTGSAASGSGDHEMNRRDWLVSLLLKASAGAATALSGTIALQSVLSSASGPRTLAVKAPQSLPDRTLVPLAQAGVAVLRDGTRIAAISTTCTHLGCALAVRDRGFECPCHGSRFDSLGQRLAGPADRDLPWYRIDRLPDGRIVIRLDEIVPSGTFSTLG